MTTKTVYRATEKATGREWLYQERRSFGHREFRAALFNGQWAPNLKLAKEMAKVAGRFRYEGDPPLVTIVD